jgi:hypothetical protein
MSAHKTRLWGAFAFAILTTATAAAAAPARPTDLRARGTSTTTAQISWTDNATDEWEYHLEVRSSATTWADRGAIPPNVTSMELFNLVPTKTYFFRLRAKNGTGWSSYSNEAAATAFYESPPSCAAGPNVMCLGDGGRYRVQATFERGSDIRGMANTVGLSEESGLFWFFSPSNVETIVKVLDGCGVNNHRWVYTTGLTDLRVLVMIADTQTGETATYLNEGGGAFAPQQDTEALSCD